MLRWLVDAEWPIDLAVAFTGWFIGALALAELPPADAALIGIIGVLYYVVCWPMVKVATGLFTGGGCLVMLAVFSWPLAIAVMVVFGALYYAVRLLSRQVALPLLRALIERP